MPCPHSSSPSADPKKCSLCMGEKARIITTDETNGTLLADGAPIVNDEGEVRRFQPGAQRHQGGSPPRRRGRPPKKLVEQRREARSDPADDSED